MRCPTLAQLPAPPAGKRGWPWTIETAQASETQADGKGWPTITVVTPSYGQAAFLEETLRSVLLQGYPALQYVVVDGGSTDGSVAIIRKYEPFLDFWVSEKDRGQSHAINKGFARARGDLRCWLNSDDVFRPGALALVARHFSEPHLPAWLIGASEIIDAAGNRIGRRSPEHVTYETLFTWPRQWFPQQSTFWTSALWEQTGPLKENLHYVMDLALWLAMYDVVPPLMTSAVLAAYREQARGKCIAEPENIPAEIQRVLKQYFKQLSPEHMALVKQECIRLHTAASLAERLLHWVHENYNRTENYDDARHYLKLARQFNPSILSNPTNLGLFLKLSGGKRGATTIKKIKGYVARLRQRMR